MAFDSKLTIDETKIVDTETGIEVMMEWERPVMKKVAEYICAGGGDILEVGFGMGISANYIQEHDINSHTIMECHPQILKILRKWAKSRPNTTIIEGDWYENVDKLGKYDGIFFDTFGDDNCFKFDNILSDISKPGARYTDWNGGGDRHYWKDVEHMEIKIKPVKNKYHKYDIDTYYMPMVKL